MSTTASNTRERIVELGRDFIQKIGYHAFKYQLIAQELNIRNAAIHHYYPNKEDLGVAIIQKDQVDFRNIARSVEKRSATEKLETLLSIYQNYCSDGKNLCVLGACSSSFNDIPESMQIAATDYHNEMQQWMMDTFAQGKASGEFTFTSTPENLAALWSAAMPGALQKAGIYGAAYLNTVLDQLRKTLNT